MSNFMPDGYYQSIHAYQRGYEPDEPSLEPGEPCRCIAYKFPHRSGGGDCDGPGAKPESCHSCSHFSIEKDPYGTGDAHFYLEECEAGECQWND